MIDVLIVGAGPAGLYAADRLSAAGLRVEICERMRNPARKFLLAGRGGLNLTHGEPLDRFTARYRDAGPFLAPMIHRFPPDALRAWCAGLGQETFVGSSGRVFPKAMKASPLLRALLQRLSTQGVQLRTGLTWTGYDPDLGQAFTTPGGEIRHMTARAAILALGGASWPKLGSDGGWVPAIQAHGIAVHAFQPANCGFHVAWSEHLKSGFAGAPLKRIRLTVGDTAVSGEALVSEKGLEGGAVYALSAEIRAKILTAGGADILVDLRPERTVDEIADRLGAPRGKQSLSTYLRKRLRMSKVEQALLREAGPLPADSQSLARRIKALRLRCTAPYEIDRAISSAGGIALGEVRSDLMLKKLPGVYAIGEMLDWEAPTGGYLLQACFSMAYAASGAIVADLAPAKPAEARA